MCRSGAGEHGGRIALRKKLHPAVGILGASLGFRYLNSPFCPWLIKMGSDYLALSFSEITEVGKKNTTSLRDV